VALPPAAPARNWEEFKRQAAQRMVQAQPGRSFMGRPPPMMLGIPVLEIELNRDGSVRNVKVIREPADSRARDTVQLAIDAVAPAPALAVDGGLPVRCRAPLQAEGPGPVNATAASRRHCTMHRCS
jgi:protein TonB